MNLELAGTFAVLAAAVAFFLSERVRPDVVALGTLVALASLGILDAAEAFSGFSSRAVMTLISVFIIAEALVRTGVSDQVSKLLLRWGGRTESRLVGLVMAAGAGLSLFLNNIAAAAVLLPAVGGASRKASIPPSKVLMPLAFATILGGMATLLTTMNIMVSDILEKGGEPGYGLLDFLPVGLPMLGAGIAYMLLFGRHRLPAGDARHEMLERARRESRLLDIYRMGEKCFRVRIPEGSYLAGKPLSMSTFREAYGLNVLAIERERDNFVPLHPDTVLTEGDVLILEGDEEEFRGRDTEPRLEMMPPPRMVERYLGAPSTVLAEVMLSPRSSLIGNTLREVEFRQKYGMTVISIWRRGSPLEEITGDEKLAFGDALLLHGPKDRLRSVELDPDLILLAMVRQPGALGKRGIAAIGILAATLAAIILTQVPMAQLLLTGALLMVVSGAVNMEQAYRAVDWSGIFLVAGMLPLAIAMTNSGAAGILSSFLVDITGGLSPAFLASALFIASALLTQAVSGAAVAAIMAPVAVSAAAVSGAPAQAFGMAVALGSSMAFITPLGHPVNVLVMSAGGYRFGDYRRAGWPLFVILTAVAVIVISLRWSLF